MVCAEPERALPRKKNPTQAIMMGRRPIMSARRPVKGRMAAAASVYAEPTQTNSSPPESSFVIVGSAVETAVTSRAERKLQTTTAVKHNQKIDPLGRLLAASPGRGEVKEWGEDIIMGRDGKGAGVARARVADTSVERAEGRAAEG